MYTEYVSTGFLWALFNPYGLPGPPFVPSPSFYTYFTDSDFLSVDFLPAILNLVFFTIFYYFLTGNLLLN